MMSAVDSPKRKGSKASRRKSTSAARLQAAKKALAELTKDDDDQHETESDAKNCGWTLDMPSQQTSGATGRRPLLRSTSSKQLIGASKETASKSTYRRSSLASMSAPSMKRVIPNRGPANSTSSRSFGLRRTRSQSRSLSIGMMSNRNMMNGTLSMHKNASMRNENDAFESEKLLSKTMIHVLSNELKGSRNDERSNNKLTTVGEAEDEGESAEMLTQRFMSEFPNDKVPTLGVLRRLYSKANEPKKQETSSDESESDDDSDDDSDYDNIDDKIHEAVATMMGVDSHSKQNGTSFEDDVELSDSGLSFASESEKKSWRAYATAGNSVDDDSSDDDGNDEDDDDDGDDNGNGDGDDGKADSLRKKGGEERKDNRPPKKGISGGESPSLEVLNIGKHKGRKSKSVSSKKSHNSSSTKHSSGKSLGSSRNERCGSGSKSLSSSSYDPKKKSTRSRMDTSVHSSPSSSASTAKQSLTKGNLPSITDDKASGRERRDRSKKSSSSLSQKLEKISSKSSKKASRPRDMGTSSVHSFERSDHSTKEGDGSKLGRKISSRRRRDASRRKSCPSLSPVRSSAGSHHSKKNDKRTGRQMNSRRRRDYPKPKSCPSLSPLRSATASSHSRGKDGKKAGRQMKSGRCPDDPQRKSCLSPSPVPSLTGSVHSKTLKTKSKASIASLTMKSDHDHKYDTSSKGSVSMINSFHDSSVSFGSSLDMTTKPNSLRSNESMVSLNGDDSPPVKKIEDRRIRRGSSHQPSSSSSLSPMPSLTGSVHSKTLKTKSKESIASLTMKSDHDHKYDTSSKGSVSMINSFHDSSVSFGSSLDMTTKPNSLRSNESMVSLNGDDSPPVKKIERRRIKRRSSHSEQDHRPRSRSFDHNSRQSRASIIDRRMQARRARSKSIDRSAAAKNANEIRQHRSGIRSVKHSHDTQDELERINHSGESGSKNFVNPGRRKKTIKASQQKDTIDSKGISGESTLESHSSAGNTKIEESPLFKNPCAPKCIESIDVDDLDRLSAADLLWKETDGHIAGENTLEMGNDQSTSSKSDETQKKEKQKKTRSAGDDTRTTSSGVTRPTEKKTKNRDPKKASRNTIHEETKGPDGGVSLWINPLEMDFVSPRAARGKKKAGRPKKPRSRTNIKKRGDV